jgi:glutathione S-transferase
MLAADLGATRTSRDPKRHSSHGALSDDLDCRVRPSPAIGTCDHGCASAQEPFSQIDIAAQQLAGKLSSSSYRDRMEQAPPARAVNVCKDPEPMHRLFYSPGACSLAAHIVLEEIGLPYQVELVSASGPREGEMTASAQWKAINPKGRVPALSDVPGRIGGRAGLLTEVPAILFYLARLHPSAGLLPREAAGEARCLEWMNYLSSSVHATAYGQIWRPLRFVNDEDDAPAVTAKGEQSVREQYEYIERLVGDGRDWAVPGSYSIVDPYLFVFFRWGRRIGIDMSTLCPAWTRLAARVVERPAVQRAMEQEGIDIG